MNVNEENLVNVEKKKLNNKAWEVVKRVLAIIGVLLLGVLFVFGAFLNDDNDEATVAHAETINNSNANNNGAIASHYLVLGDGCTFNSTSPNTWVLIFGIVGVPQDLGDGFFGGQFVSCGFNVINADGSAFPYYSLAGGSFYFNVTTTDNRVYTTVGETYIPISNTMYESLIDVDLTQTQLYFINFSPMLEWEITIPDYRIVPIESGGGGASEEDLQDAYNQGVDGLITTDYGFDMLYINNVSNILLEGWLDELTYTNNLYYVYYQDVNNYCFIEKELLGYNISVVSNGTAYNVYQVVGGWNIPESGYIDVNITSPKTEVNGLTVGAQNELLTGFLNVHTNYVKADVNTGYNNGYDSGYDVGYDVGYEDGSNDTSNDMYDQIQNAYDDGYYDGEEEGYKNGYNLGVSEQITLNPVSTFLEPVSAFMNINLFGGFSIGMAFSVVLFVGVALIFIKMFAGG